MSINRNVLGLTFIIVILAGNSIFAQNPIPFGTSLDSIQVSGLFSNSNKQSFHCYKPTSYNPNSSPILLAIHGTGGNGSSTIPSLDSIAERRSALIIAPNFSLSGYPTTMISQTPITTTFDLISGCVFYSSTTEIMYQIYQHILARENRSSIPVYMIGFSSGGQFVSRYMMVRQSYPDSIPIKMAVSANAYYYTFPTDSLLGVAMPWLCGLIFPDTVPSPANCYSSLSIYNWDCNEHIVQYYNENYGVLIGTGDTSPLNDAPCAMITGSNRYERALNFYNFADSNAVSRGTSLRWIYQEVQGVGHDQYLMYNSKASPADTSTIAETLLFDSPYQAESYTAPNASFYADTAAIEVGDSVHFINTSINATNYEWNFGDSTLSTNVSPWHTYSALGLYTVMLTAFNSNGCDNWHERRNYIEVINPSSISEIDFDKVVKLYPNPAIEQFIVQIESFQAGNGNLVIRDMIGLSKAEKVVEIGTGPNEFTMLCENLAPGVYFVETWLPDGNMFNTKLSIIR